MINCKLKISGRKSDVGGVYVETHIFPIFWLKHHLDHAESSIENFDVILGSFLPDIILKFMVKSKILLR